MPDSQLLMLLGILNHPKLLITEKLLPKVPAEAPVIEHAMENIRQKQLSEEQLKLTISDMPTVSIVAITFTILIIYKSVVLFDKIRFAGF